MSDFKEVFAEELDKTLLIGELKRVQDETTGNLVYSFHPLWLTVGSLQRRQSPREVTLASGEKVVSWWRLYLPQEADQVIDSESSRKIQATAAMYGVEKLDFSYEEDIDVEMIRFLRIYEVANSHLEIDVEVIRNG